MENFFRNPVLCLLVLWYYGIQTVLCEDIFISRSDGIYHAELSGTTIENTESRVHQSSGGDIIALAVDTRDSIVFWYDSSTGANGIYKGTFQNRAISSPSNIVQYPDMFVSGLAVDWSMKHLYWSDSFHSFVMVSDYSGNHRVVAVSGKLTLPRGLSINLTDRSLYIGDQGSHVIMKCTMDGIFTCTHITEAVYKGIVWPNQLSVFQSNVSWTDGWSNKVVSCSLDLSECRDMMVNTANFNNGHSSTIFGMIVTNSGTIVSTLNSFITISASDGSTTVHNSAQGRTYYIVSTNTQTQPTVTDMQCRLDTCSQLCFPTSMNVPRCSCSSFSDKVLAGNSCVSATDMLVYADMTKGQIGLVSTMLNSHTVIALSTQPRSLAYDPVTQMIYYSDIKYQTIYRVGLDGSSPSVFLSRQSGIGKVEAMSVDQKQRRLYFINRFDWEFGNVTNTMARIEMAGLDTGERAVVYRTNDTVTDIEIIHFQTSSFLFYSVGEPNPAVYQLTLDGRSIAPLMADFTNPTLLSSWGTDLYIYDNTKIFTMKADRMITTYNLNKKAVAMTSDSARIYFGTGNMSMIIRALTNVSPSTVPTSFNPVDILFVDTRSATQRDLGLCENGNLCKDTSICFRTNNPDIVRCKCPANRFNSPTDGSRQCSEPNKYLLVSDVDGIKMTSFDDELRNIYTIIPNDRECKPYHGLTTDGSRIFFATYDGNILYNASNKGQDVSVLKVLRNMTVLNIVYQDNTLYWSGHYDCFLYNGSLGGIPECRAHEGILGGIFSLDLTSKQVSTLVEDIIGPQGVAADFRYVYWSDSVGVKRMLRAQGSTPESVLEKPNVFSLKQNRLKTHLFLGGGDLAFRRFASQDFPYDIIYSGANDVRGLHVQGSLVFASDWDSRSIIQHDLRTHQTSIVTNDLGRPGQIVMFGLDNDIREKPGECPGSTCNTAVTSTCQNDVDCLDGFESKCCLTMINNECRRECRSPVAKAVCNISFVDQPSFTWGVETVTNDKCTTCTCVNGNANCSDVQCPKLDECAHPIKEQGSCCSVCRDITTCQGKPTINGCPRPKIDVPLSTSLPSNNFDEPVKIDVQHISSLGSITAFSCNQQQIPQNRISWSPSSLTWQKEFQNVMLKARDDNGEKVCGIDIRVVDETPPVFIHSPNETHAYIYATSIEGAEVFWAEPIVYDNSGFKPTLNLSENYENGMTLPPGFYSISYSAIDLAGNMETITFHINVTIIPDMTCPLPPFFHFGSVVCDKGDDDITTCIADCHNDFIFDSDRFQKKHRCVDGQWMPPYLPDFRSACLRPEATVLKASPSVELDCGGNKIVPNDVIQCLHSGLSCNTRNIVLCEEEAITISQEGSSTVVTVDATGVVPFRKGYIEQDLAEVNRTLSEKANGVENLFTANGLKQFCPFLKCSIKSKRGIVYKKTCEKGAISHNVMNKFICAKCAPGMQFIETINGASKCEFCGEGTYQSKPGQTECKTCPSDRPHSKRGSWLTRQCLSSSDTTDESSDITTIAVVVVAIFVFLVIGLCAAYLIVKRRKSKGKMAPSSHANPVFDLETDEYDRIPADHDHDDPAYTGLTAEPPSQYQTLGDMAGAKVSYNKTSDSIATDNMCDNPYNMVGETNPYAALKTANMIGEHPYELNRQK